MGTAKRRKQTFLAQHPICFNCGVAPATTEDHVPSRQCFVGKQWPEGFVFPACHPCNSKISKIEQAMALLIRLADHDESRINEAELLRMINGVRNNTPELLPMEFSDRNKRDAVLDSIGWEPGEGETYDDAPIVEMNPGWRAAVHAFSRKLTLALHYKEVGVPLPQDHWIRTEFFQFTDAAAPSLVAQFQEMLPNFRMGNRRNVDFGDQFMYIMGQTEDVGVFAFLAQLSKSWFITGVTVASNNPPEPEKYIRHADALLLDV